jgi:hypothetical protein
LPLSRRGYPTAGVAGDPAEAPPADDAGESQAPMTALPPRARKQHSGDTPDGGDREGSDAHPCIADGSGGGEAEMVSDLDDCPRCW